jgi:hypothetical protein
MEKEQLFALQQGLNEAELAGLGAHLDTADTPMDEEAVEAKVKPVGRGAKRSGEGMGV